MGGLPDLYFYHPDHLGSASYITDTQGKLYEHLEYFPFGETWVEESSNTQRTPYLFTSKELDEETGLYYFGARYYDPRTSVWQSGDPILGKYLPSAGEPISKLSGMGGVINPKNLGMYSYAHLNSVRHNDPDGKVPVDTVWDALNVVYDLGKAGVGYATGNSAMVAEGLSDAAADTAAMFVPYLPAGSTKVARAVAKQAPEIVDDVKRVATVSKKTHPQAAKHIEDAQQAGKPSVLTVGDPATKSARRREAMAGHKPEAGKDRDEYPPAMFGEGGRGASVRNIDPSDNRGAGACIGNQCRGLSPGDKVEIKVVD